MNRWVLLWTVAALPAQASAVDIRGKGSEAVDQTVEAVRGETPEAQDWAGKRLEALREDFDRFDRRLESAEPDRREKARAELSELKERVSKLEGRIDQKPADEKVYDEVEDEIDDIRDDFRDLRRKTIRR